LLLFVVLFTLVHAFIMARGSMHSNSHAKTGQQLISGGRKREVPVHRIMLLLAQLQHVTHQPTPAVLPGRPT
jgi:hypothetical protein